MRILFVGDIVGQPGRTIVRRAVPRLIAREKLDLVVVNAENAAAGSGLTPVQFNEIIGVGVDGVTLGDHIYRRAEICGLLERATNIVKPANFPAAAPGRDHAILTARDGTQVAIISLLGRVFMKPVDCPFQAVDRVLKSLPAEVKVILVDVHAEATSDKQLLGRYLSGRVSAVLGTHTHVATADEHVTAQGTAFQCDVGMSGPHDGIIGRRYDRVLETTLTFQPTHFEVADEDLRLNGAIVDVDPETGRATAIQRICVRESELASM